jgi:hypothetical protein
VKYVFITIAIQTQLQQRSNRGDFDGASDVRANDNIPSAAAGIDSEALSAEIRTVLKDLQNRIVQTERVLKRKGIDAVRGDLAEGQFKVELQCTRDDLGKLAKEVEGIAHLLAASSVRIERPGAGDYDGGGGRAEATDVSVGAATSVRTVRNELNELRDRMHAAEQQIGIMSSTVANLKAASCAQNDATLQHKSSIHDIQMKQLSYLQRVNDLAAMVEILTPQTRTEYLRQMSTYPVGAESHQSSAQVSPEARERGQSTRVHWRTPQRNINRRQQCNRNQLQRRCTWIHLFLQSAGLFSTGRGFSNNPRLPSAYWFFQSTQYRTRSQRRCRARKDETVCFCRAARNVCVQSTRILVECTGTGSLRRQKLRVRTACSDFFKLPRSHAAAGATAGALS